MTSLVLSRRIASAHRPGVPLARMLENCTHATIAEIAATEKINESYVGRVLRLSLLVPNIVEAIMGGLQPAAVTLEVLLQPFALEWTEQRRPITPC